MPYNCVIHKEMIGLTNYSFLGHGRQHASVMQCAYSQLRNAFSSSSCQLISLAACVTSFGDHSMSPHLKPSVSMRPSQMAPVNPRMRGPGPTHTSPRPMLNGVPGENPEFAGNLSHMRMHPLCHLIQPVRRALQRLPCKPLDSWPPLFALSSCGVFPTWQAGPILLGRNTKSAILELPCVTRSSTSSGEQPWDRK